MKASIKIFPLLTVNLSSLAILNSPTKITTGITFYMHFSVLSPSSFPIYLFVQENNTSWQVI